MSWCNRATITDAAFVHLRGIQTLDMEGCNQATITGAAMSYLVGIRMLDTGACSRDVRVTVAKLRAEFESESEFVSESEDEG